MIRDTGENAISSADEMNIPVICFLFEPDRENGLWTWTATNFMPRKSLCSGTYRLEADTKEEIMEVVQRYVTPLYEIAANNMKTKGKNYYWEVQP